MCFWDALNWCQVTAGGWLNCCQFTPVRQCHISVTLPVEIYVPSDLFIPFNCRSLSEVLFFAPWLGNTRALLVSHLPEPVFLLASPLSIICKMWQGMTLLILKDYFPMVQFVTK